jgi:hypothetical protein
MEGRCAGGVGLMGVCAPNAIICYKWSTRGLTGTVIPIAPTIVLNAIPPPTPAVNWYIGTSPHWYINLHISTSPHQHINQHISTSPHQHINQHISTSPHWYINQHISTSPHQHINTPQQNFVSLHRQSNSFLTLRQSSKRFWDVKICEAVDDVTYYN